jgi:hypothetical protein
MADLSVSMRNASFLCTTCVKYHVICSDERNVNIALRVLVGPDVAGHDTRFSTQFAVGMHSLCDALYACCQAWKHVHLTAEINQMGSICRDCEVQTLSILHGTISVAVYSH